MLALHADHLPVVRGSDPVLNGSARFGPTPDPEPDPGPDLSPVREGSGPDQSSELNCGNPIQDRLRTDLVCIACVRSHGPNGDTRQAGANEWSPVIVNLGIN